MEGYAKEKEMPWPQLKLSKVEKFKKNFALRLGFDDELAHLIEFGHGPAFEALVAVYPHDARARGYLDGWIDGSGQRVDDADDCAPVDLPHPT